MKKEMAMGLALLLTAGCANAKTGEITVSLPQGYTGATLNVEEGYIKDVANQKRGEKISEKISVPVKDGKAVIPVMADGASQYVLQFGDRDNLVVYTEPGENINVTVTALGPAVYTATGSQLMEGISAMDDASNKILNQFFEERGKATPDVKVLENLENQYNKVFTDYIARNPESPASAYALLHMEGEDFIKAYNAMSPAVKGSLLAPYVERQKQYVDRTLEAERKKAQMTSGTVLAPDFTFKDTEGKDVSLSQFRGKWVIIDFWGSWCRWCIKGFPSLKEAYAKYKPELEVVGVACSDPEDAWRNAIKKYELPWVNLYNPEQGGGDVLEEYGVQGFPTKVIVDPKGYIRNITSGDNPAFYDTLKDLMGK